MMMTMDALMGATLSLTMMSVTMPVMVNAAKKAADVRKDAQATMIASYCNNAMVSEEDIDATDIKATKGIESITGDCGVSRGSLLLTFKSGDTRAVEYDDQEELYTL